MIRWYTLTKEQVSAILLRIFSTSSTIETIPSQSQTTDKELVFLPVFIVSTRAMTCAKPVSKLQKRSLDALTMH